MLYNDVLNVLVPAGALAATLLGEPKTKAKIQNIVLDCSINENHSYKNTITSNPVESGARLDDHVTVNPFQLSITGMITDSPVEILGGAINSKPEGQKATEKAYETLVGLTTLETLRQNQELITIVTSLDTYTNMIIESLSFPRNAGIGKSLKFSVMFKQMNFATTVDVLVPVLEPKRASKKVNKGAKSQQDKVEKVKTQSTSTAKLIFNPD